MNFKRTQTWPGKTHSIIQRSAWGPKSLCIYINQCIVNFNWPMSCARAFLRNNWLPHFRLLLSSPSLSIQNMTTRAMIHPHFKIDEKWILTFLYIYRWNIDLKEKKYSIYHSSSMWTQCQENDNSTLYFFLALRRGANPWHFAYSPHFGKKWTTFFATARHIHKKYHMQKIWSKSVIPALGSGQSNLQRPVWGRHHQLDDR